MGKSTGKVGPVITAGWKGLNVVKQYFKPSNPRTPAQQQNRSRFATLVALARSILYIIVKPIWDKLSDNMSGFNLIVKEFMLTADENNTLTTNTKISRGTLVGFDGLQVNTDGTEIGISWNDNSNSGNAKSTDKCYFILYDKQKKLFWGHNFATVQRSDGNYQYFPQGQELSATQFYLLSYLKTPKQERFIQIVQQKQLNQLNFFSYDNN